MKKDGYSIRRMTRKDLDIAVSWAATEGWNPGLYDADCFYAQDPKGFFMGFFEGKPVSSISAVSYGKHFGFLGFYIVKPEFRKKTFGIQIWKAALKYLSNRNIGLDGVVAQQENYKKSGFKLAYRNIRFEGKGGEKAKEISDIIKLSEIPFAKLRKYDAMCFPAPRPQFLKKWIKQPKSFAVGTVEKNNLTGYGMIRKCQNDYKIGPLFADNEKIAEKLFAALSSFVKKGTPIYLDIPEVNPAAVALAKRHQMKYVFETARMYTITPPKLPLHKIFGVTSFELG